MLLNRKYVKYFECFFYVFILVILLKNHQAFLKYALNFNILARIHFSELAFNLIYTPLLLLLFLLNFWGYGRKILSLLCKDALLTDYQHIVSIVLGIGMFNLIMQIIGFLKVLTLTILVAVLLIGVISFLHEFASVKKSFSFKHFRLPNEVYKRIFFVIIAVALFFGTMKALSPPISRDALYCHLSVAYKYAVSNGIVLDPSFNLMSCMVGMEMLTTSALMLKSDLLAQLLPLVSEVLLLLGIFIFARKRFSVLVAWASMAFLAILPTTQYLSGIVNNDLYSACCSFFAVVFLLEFMESKKPEYLNLVGAFCGLSSGAKIIGLLPSGWIGLVIAVLIIRKKISLRSLIVPFVVFIIFASQQYGRNLYLSHNPVFPLYTSFFGGQQIADSVLKLWALWKNAIMGVEVNIKNFILLPYSFIVSPKLFGIYSRYIVFSFLIFMIFGFFNFRKESVNNKFLLSYIMYYFVVWFILGQHVWRYLLHIFPFVCILLISYWEHGGSRLRRVVLGVILALNVVPLLQSDVNNNLFAVFAMPSIIKPGRSPRKRYLERSLTQFLMYEYINTNLASNVKILLFREVLGYHLKREYVQGDPFRNNIIYEDINSPDILHKQLEEYGITHILVNTNNFKNVSYNYTFHVFRLMEDFLMKYTKLTHKTNGVELYEVKSGIGVQ